MKCINVHVTLCMKCVFLAAPGPPTLEELQTDNLSINVTWREPEEKNGDIINYQVEWTDWNGEEGSKSTDGNTFSLQIMEPSCGEKVDVTVRAKTVEFGEKSPTRSAYIVNSSKCSRLMHQRFDALEVLIQRHSVINMKRRNCKVVDNVYCVVTGVK